MVGHDIIVIGASAGGVQSLRALARLLPPDFAAAVFAVVHGTSRLAEILTGALPATTAVDGDRIIPGRILVAPAERHLLLEPGRVAVVAGPKENRYRPSIDALFRSAAIAYGSRVVGIMLSGMLDDGVAGLWAIKRRGGLVIVQDPSDAQFPDMPNAALAQIEVDHCVPVSGMPMLLSRLLAIPAALMEPVSAEPVNLPPQPTRYICPECHGPLAKLFEDPPRFACPVGHLYSLFGLMQAQTEMRENILWSAVRALEDHAHLTEQELAAHVTPANDETRKVLATEATRARTQAEQIRGILATRPWTSAT